MSFFRERWYALPTLSGLLLLFAAPPFSLWPLVFVALVPLYWSIAAEPRTAKETFLSGCVTAGLYIFSLYYLTLFQFQWLPGSENLLLLIRAGIVPATLAGAGLLGASMWAYRHARTRHIALNACIGGAAFLLFELPFSIFFQGYYPGTLAYIIVPLPFLMHFAVLGGTALVSFIVAAVACFIAEALVVLRAGLTRRDTLNSVLFLGVLVCAGLFSGFFVAQSSTVVRTISVAIPQPGAYEDILFGTTTSGGFSFLEFKAQFTAALFENVDFIFYPQSFFDGFLYKGEPPQGGDVALAPHAQVGGWIEKTFPSGAIVATWDSVYEGGGAYNEYQFWQRGEVVGTYKKHELHFLDNTSTWLGEMGAYQTRFFYTPGYEASQPLEVEGVPIGTAICSEVMREPVVRAQAKDASLLLSMGSETGFFDDTIGILSLRAAQYRAVEYNLPVVRADAVGPSALIDARGTITALAPWHTHAVLRGSVVLYTPHQTPYARFGSIPLYVLLAAFLTAALVMRYRGRSDNSN